MNTWGYLILIIALLGLSALMLYARFSMRSREKSLHHAPKEAGSLLFLGTSDPVTETETEAKADPLVMDLRPLDSRRTEKEDSGEGDYFDELQEAAAGLAMLMRSSSAVNRSAPVIFAPEEKAEALESEEVMLEAEEAALEFEEVILEAVAEEAPVLEQAPAEVIEGEEIDLIEPLVPEVVEDMNSGDSAGATLEDPIEEPVSLAVAPVAEAVVAEEIEAAPVLDEIDTMSEAIDSVEALLAEAPILAADAADFIGVTLEEEAPAPAGLEALLGEEIAGKFLKLDAGLDELELLVVGIEEQLGRLQEFVGESEDRADVDVAA